MSSLGELANFGTKISWKDNTYCLSCISEISWEPKGVVLHWPWGDKERLIWDSPEEESVLVRRINQCMGSLYNYQD